LHRRGEDKARANSKPSVPSLFCPRIAPFGSRETRAQMQEGKYMASERVSVFSEDGDAVREREAEWRQAGRYNGRPG
jgi:hypothetical protein